MKPIEIHYYVYPKDTALYKAHLWVEKNTKRRGKSEFCRQAVLEKVEDIKNKKKWSE